MMKMIRWKKWLAAVCAVVIGVGCLTGCGGAADGNSADSSIANGNAGNGSSADGSIANDSEAGTSGSTADNNSGNSAEPSFGERHAAPDPSKMRGELTISCLYQNEFLERAASQFMKKYPNVKVDIHVNAEEDREDAVENYLTYLNTRIMTGEAEDIFDNAFLPVEKYKAMGVFENLAPYIAADGDINEENYFMNVLEADRDEKGAIYLLPYGARFKTVGFSDALLKECKGKDRELKKLEKISFPKAMDMARGLADETEHPRTFLTQESEIAYMDNLVDSVLERFLDVEGKRADFTSGDYAALLESVKGLADHGYFQGDEEINFYEDEYYFASTLDFEIQNAFYNLARDGGVRRCLPLSNEAGVLSTSVNNCLMMNSRGKQKELAWEFLRYVLSAESESLPSVWALPVNRQGFKNAVSRYYKFYSKGNPDAGVKEKDYYDLLKKWMDQVGDCHTMDYTITMLMDGENREFFAGRQSAEATAEKIQKKMEQYFDEQ